MDNKPIDRESVSPPGQWRELVLNTCAVIAAILLVEAALSFFSRAIREQSIVVGAISICAVVLSVVVPVRLLTSAIERRLRPRLNGKNDDTQAETTRQVMSRAAKRRNLFILGSLFLAAVGVLAVPSWRMRQAIAVVEACGGGISDDAIAPFGSGPQLVTFDISGIEPTVSDSDAPRLARAFASFPELRRLIFANTPLGDAFFTTLAPGVSVEEIDLSHTRCGDAGVLALAEHRSARQLRIEGLTLSEETRKLLADRGLVPPP